MGRSVQAALDARGHSIAAMVGSHENAGGAALMPARLTGVDVALEFTTPGTAPANVARLLAAGIPVVCGTTGWEEQIPSLEALARARMGALLIAANFSIGVHVMLHAARTMAAAFRNRPEFEGFIVETHHRAKRDAPSGTGLAIQRAAREAGGGDVPITSIRAGTVPGTHELRYEGPFESLSLEHVARDRQRLRHRRGARGGMAGGTHGGLYLRGRALREARMTALGGCGTAIVTPFTDDGAVDWPALRALVEWQVAEGIDFIVACGTTGEAQTLTDDERVRVVATSTQEVAAGRVPVMAGATSNDTRRAVEEARRMCDAGADFILSASPYYNRPDAGRPPTAISRPWPTRAPGPVVLYNVPGRAGVNLLPATAAAHRGAREHHRHQGSSGRHAPGARAAPASARRVPGLLRRRLDGAAPLCLRRRRPHLRRVQ